MRAEATADNTSIRVSWEWSRDGVLMCIDLVSVCYQPERGCKIMYTNTTAITNATLPNLQCDTNYTIWVHAKARGGHTGKRSGSRMAYLPVRGICTCNNNVYFINLSHCS